MSFEDVDLPVMEQLKVTVPYEGCWRVTFDHPPYNLMDATTVSDLVKLISVLELSGDAVRVVVFDSANPEHWFGRYDFSSGGLPTDPGPTGLPPFLDLTVRLSQLSAVTIAAIRGRTRGGGNEFALACDLRFASAERAFFAQPEIGTGLIPGGGGIERLTETLGRARTLEMVLSADDFTAKTAERYGVINRTLPDDELDDFVNAFARRIASFDASALRTAKQMVDRHTLPDPNDLLESQKLCMALTQSPSFLPRFTRVRATAALAGTDFDLRLGHHLGALTETSE